MERRLDTKFVRSRASAVYSKARDSRARDLVSDTFQDRLGPLAATYITFVQVRFSEFFSCYAPVLSAGYPASYLQRPRTGGGGTVPRLVA